MNDVVGNTKLRELRTNVFMSNEPNAYNWINFRDAYIIGFTGAKGGGKTLTMSWLAAYLMIHGYPVWANYNINFKYRNKKGQVSEYKSKPLDFDALYALSKDIKHGVTVIDELPLFADSRRSGSLNNRLLGYILMQTRKRQMSVFYTAQNMSWTDNRFRWSTDVIVACKDAYHREHHYARGEYIDVLLWDMSGQWTGKPWSEYPYPVNSYTFYGKSCWGIYDTKDIIDAFEAMTPIKLDLENRLITNKMDRGKLTSDIDEVINGMSESGKTTTTTDEIIDALGGEVSATVIGRQLKKLGLKKKQGTTGKREYLLTSD